MVHISNGTNIRQAGGGTSDTHYAILVLTFREVTGLTGVTVGGDALQSGSIIKISIIIVRIYGLRKTTIQKVLIDDAPLTEKVFQTYVMILVHHLNVRKPCSPSLMAHVGESVAGSCRHGYRIGELHVSVYEVVQYAAGENAAHTSAFQDEAGVLVYFHSILFVLRVTLRDLLQYENGLGYGVYIRYNKFPVSLVLGYLTAACIVHSVIYAAGKYGALIVGTDFVADKEEGHVTGLEKDFLYTQVLA
jgi:hypothetical protein